MRQYELLDSFEVDDDSLSALSGALCFTLGVEWAMIRARIVAGEEFRCFCHTANAPRIEKLAERHGRFVEHHAHAAGWSEVFVGSRRA